jgi:hypothetical protein
MNNLSTQSGASGLPDVDRESFLALIVRVLVRWDGALASE